MPNKLERYREVMQQAHEERMNVLQQLKAQFEKQISEIDSIGDPHLKMNTLEVAAKVFKVLY